MVDKGSDKLGSSEGMRNQRGTPSSSQSGASSGEPGHQAERDVGSALRSAYSATVSEGTPQEFLDLLGKLS